MSWTHELSFAQQRYERGTAPPTPNNCVLNEAWFRLKVCARYGMDPAGAWFDALAADTRLLLLAFEQVEMVRDAAGQGR